MRASYMKLTDILRVLNPATTKFVKYIILMSDNGSTFAAYDLALDRDVIYAQSGSKDCQLVLPYEELCGIQVSFDKDKLSDIGVSPHIPDVIAHLKRS